MAILQQNYIATFGGGRGGEGRWDSFAKQWSQFKSFDDVDALSGTESCREASKETQ